MTNVLYIKIIKYQISIIKLTFIIFKYLKIRTTIASKTICLSLAFHFMDLKNLQSV